MPANDLLSRVGKVSILLLLYIDINQVCENHTLVDDNCQLITFMERCSAEMWSLARIIK